MTWGSPSSGPSLAALRQRAAGLGSEAGLRALARELRADPRRGAQALAARCLRRASSLARERQRLAGLLALREQLRRRGMERVAGVDEVGMGPLAGPVVAAAVVLPRRPELPGLDDSKRLAASVRERLAEAIRRQALGVGVAEVWPPLIDRLNVYRAGLLAMTRAVRALPEAPDFVLVDARTLPDLALPQRALVRGDARDASIAAASIVAKVHRDAIMRRLDRRFPAYGFCRHMGYPTPEHLDALHRVGPSPVHRRSFAPVARHAALGGAPGG